MLFGYARVSSVDQDLALQRDALTSAGVHRIFEDRLSGVAYRPRLEALLYCLRRGDVLVVYKLDRLARSLADLLRVLERIQRCGASVRSLTESIDTSTCLGRLTIQLLGSFAEFERGVIRERCAAGTAAAKARGVRWGRPRTLDWAKVRQLSAEGRNPCQIARLYGVHHSAVRYVLASPLP